MKSKGTEETIFVGDGQNYGMEVEFVVCERVEEIGKEQKSTQVKAPPQTRRAVIRVESAETQDKVSEPQGFEEIDDEEMMGELSFIPSAVSEPGWALHRCDKMQQRWLQVLPTCGLCNRRRRSTSYDQLVQATSDGFQVEMIEQKAFRGKLWVTCGMEQLCEVVGTCHHQKKCGSDQFW